MYLLIIYIVDIYIYISITTVSFVEMSSTKGVYRMLLIFVVKDLFLKIYKIEIQNNVRAVTICMRNETITNKR